MESNLGRNRAETTTNCAEFKRKKNKESTCTEYMSNPLHDQVARAITPVQGNNNNLLKEDEEKLPIGSFLRYGSFACPCEANV
ncbi:hypothetical protein OUZ56_014227 [Daphnia magna]|uniref:Uncharacterized protein n=1 Tax=Daphnia magna TaxID=35525 RepID=A0ABQ9Z866_9CRUS|nr:hypothetical protein OUZ56_014227 [Daphnia magna]